MTTESVVLQLTFTRHGFVIRGYGTNMPGAGELLRPHEHRAGHVFRLSLIDLMLSGVLSG